MLEGNVSWISVQNFKSISSKMAEIWHKTCQKQALSRHFGTLPWFSEFYFLTDFDASKSVLGSFFVFFAKIWPKNMYRSSKSRFFFVWPFHFVTWDDLDLYYGQKAQEMILTDVSDTIHADLLALFAFNIEILLANVTKPEMSNILTLTWPVTSLMTPRSIKVVFPRQFFQGFQMPFEFWESVQ